MRFVPKRWVETTGKRFGPDTLRGREPYLFYIPYVDVYARTRDTTLPVVSAGTLLKY